MDPDQHQGEKQSVFVCVIVGDVPNNSGYMLRFKQEHACLRLSTKPVDMPEDTRGLSMSSPLFLRIFTEK